MAIRSFCFIEGAPIGNVGGQTLTFSWAKQLIEDTVRWFPEATVVCPSANGDAARGRELVPLDSRLLEVTPLPSPAGRLRRYLAQIPALWKAVGESDLVCADIPYEGGFLAALICGLRGKALVVQILGDWELSVRCNQPPGARTWAKGKFARLMALASVRCAKLVFVQGENLRSQYGTVNGKAFRTSIIHSTLTEDIFCRREFKGFHTPLRLLSVMGLVPLKRGDVALEAIRDLRSRGVDVEWTCAGDGPAGERLRKMAEELGVEQVVRFPGYVPFGPALLSLYRESDILIHPSATEGIPHSVLEAMANSLPVVATSAGGIPSLVSDGVEAVLARPGDPQQLADGVMRLLRHPALAGRLSVSAYSRAREFHSEILSRRRRDLIEETFGKIDHDGAR